LELKGAIETRIERLVLSARSSNVEQAETSLQKLIQHLNLIATVTVETRTRGEMLTSRTSQY
jgi:hypothetical protein